MQSVTTCDKDREDRLTFMNWYLMGRMTEK